MTTPSYWSDWRKAHPAYRTRQNELRNARRRERGRNRTVEYDKRRRDRVSRAIPPMPGLHVGHPFFDLARAILGPRLSRLTSLYDPLYDDLMSEATLAFVEGRDPRVAVRRFRAIERTWGRITGPLFGELAS